MPPLPGEDRLVTVFADVHYYFAHPTIRPILHRFDKASYFYIYYNATKHSSRIEIANNPGTSDQDAVNGYIDKSTIINSYKFPTLATLVIDGSNSGNSSLPGREPEEWRLSTGDLRDVGRSKHRLHTMDIYFWAQEDARLVIECFKKLLHPSQLDIVELEPQQNVQSTGPTNALSPVVQNLESVAISDPSYNSQRRQTSFSSHGQSPPIIVPPPPSGPPPQGVQHVNSPSPVVSDISNMDSVKNDKSATTFVPMAYNPAAPPAPEPIKHREKTPPPEDGTTGTGLQAAATHDQSYRPGQSQTHSYTGGPQLNHYGHYGSPPPPHSSAGYGSPSPSSTAYASHPPQSVTSPSHEPHSSFSSATPSFGPHAVSSVGRDHRHSVAAEMYVPHQQQSGMPVETPGAQFYSTIQPSQKPLQHVQPQYADYLSAGGSPSHQAHGGVQPPLGGFSQYSYTSAQGSNDHGGNTNPYDVHNQVYRPTEDEYAAHHRKPSKKPSNSKPVSKLEQGADRVDKGVAKLFKRIEKKIG